jgi:NADPH2:quinone reductase
MKAYVVGPEGPEIRDIQTPKPRDGQVLLRVRAAALNRADLGMAKGRAHGSIGGAGTVLGLECAGEVVEAGPGVPARSVGKRLMGSVAGAFADFAVVDLKRCYPVPDGLDFDAAATLPTALSTMHNAVVTEGGLKLGQSLIVHGASSGVGIMAMRIAKLRGAELVIGTSTDRGRRERLAEFGADLALDPNDPAWVDQVLEVTEGEGVDLVIDQVSGRAINDVMRATKVRGRIVNVGRLGGDRADFDFDLHALRRIKYVGVTFRTRTPDEVRAITDAVQADLWDAVVGGSLSLPIDRSFPFDNIAQAFNHMAANNHFGKIVVRM